MSELEQPVEDYFRTRIQQRGGLAIKMAPMQAGIPDRLVILPGNRMYLVELKRDDTRRSAIQKVWHRRLAKIGTTVVTLHGRAEIDSWLSSL